jgi:hypothetical protein
VPQAVSRADRWWSGTGSNCRPSAFQKVCRSRCHRVSIDQSAQLERIHPGSWADTTILTPVPRCAGECRFVRVTGVLDASWTRTCVALVFRSSPGQPSRLHPRTRPCNTGTRARPRLSTPTIFHPMPTAARRPAAADYPLACQPSRYPPARPGMTHRDGQSMCRRIKSTHNEYLHLSEGGRRRPIKHRSARSGRPQRYPLPAESCGTAAVSPFAIMGRRPSRYGIQARDV